MTPIGASATVTPDQQTYWILGAAMETHRQLGCGFLEPVYQEALELEFQGRGIPFVREVELPVFYKGQRLSLKYRADFICFDQILVELKAMSRLSEREASQVINYLSASQLHRGLLLNFGSGCLQFRRLVWHFRDPIQSAQSAQSAGKQS
ncbi:MAG TPA: GxxExxY protein [Gemmatimonadales bacterium]|nr:GxxExxY protein [Gemmatimonadales bacterium]